MTTAPEAGQYDSPWKEALEEAFPEFVAFYFPDAHRQIDWSREHIFLDKELRQVVRDAELGRRFGPLPQDILDRIDRADSAQLETWTDRVIDATSLDEVFAEG